MSNGATPITITGNLVDDPELRFTPSGQAVASFTVAVNRKKFDSETKRWEDEGTDFHRCSAWRSLAENIAGSLLRGHRVVVDGILRSSQYEDREGNNRVAWEITAHSVGAELTFASVKVDKTAYHKPASPAPEKTSERTGRTSRSPRK